MNTLLLLVVFASAKKPVEPPAPAWKCGDAVAADHKAGMAALLASDWPTAETSFVAVLAAEPSCGLALTGLGRSRFMQDKFAEAEEPLKKATGLFADQLDPFTWLARTQIAAGKADDALATAKAAMVIKPASVDAQRVAQQVLLAKGDTAGAHAMIVAVRAIANNAAWDCFEGITYAREGEMGKAMSYSTVCQGVPDATLYGEFTKELSAAVARSEAAAPAVPLPVEAAPAGVAPKK